MTDLLKAVAEAIGGYGDSWLDGLAGIVRVDTISVTAVAIGALLLLRASHGSSIEPTPLRGPA